MAFDFNNFGTKDFGATPSTPGVPVNPAQPTKSSFDFTNFGTKDFGTTTTTQTREPGFLSRVTSPGFFKASPTDTAGEAALKTAGNVIPSALGFAKSAVQMVAHPIKTIGAIGTNVKNEGLVKGAYESLVPQFFQQLFKGDLEGAQQTITNDPSGTLLPVLLGAKGLAERAGYGAQFDNVIKNVASPITATEPGTISLAKGISKPITAAKSGVGFVANRAISAATGLEPDTITTLLDQPKAFKKGVDRQAIAEDVHSTLTEARQQLSETGKEYNTIREQGGQVNNVGKPIIEGVLKKYGIGLDSKGKLVTTAESVPLSAGDKTAIEGFVKQYGGSKLSGNAFLNARKALSNMAKYDATKTDVSTTISRELRKAYDIQGKEQLKGLETLDKKFKPLKEQFDSLKRDYLKADGTFKDNAISKIANLGSKGREQVLRRLEQVQPGIGKKLAVLKAMEDIDKAMGNKVGTYTRSTLSGGGLVGGLITGNPFIVGGSIVEAILANPKIAASILRGYARTKGLTASALAPVNKIITEAATTINNITEPGGVKNALDKTKNINIGLTTKAVGGYPDTLKAPTFKGFSDLTTKILDKLKGRSTVSKQFISDLTNSPELKQAERDIIRNALVDEKGTINVKDFANKVKAELLPLKVTSNIPKDAQGIADYNPGRYETTVLPDELRGNVANYEEKVYNSPIKTSAGNVHFSHLEDPSNYFAHTRIEDLANTSAKDTLTQTMKAKPGSIIPPLKSSTRRVIELQSDLFQKGRLEGEQASVNLLQNNSKVEQYIKSLPKTEQSKIPSWLGGTEAYLKKNNPQLLDEIMGSRNAEVAKLEPYRNTWHERIIREEVKKAAQDGKTKLQFPTGETAMKIEGLGQNADTWITKTGGNSPLTSENLKTGDWVRNRNGNTDWIITDVLGDGKFKAVPKDYFDEMLNRNNPEQKIISKDKMLEHMRSGNAGMGDARAETFDISGKVDTNNPIYKFYEKEVGRYLKNKYGATMVTDPQGVTWWQVNITPNMGKLPVEAYAVAPLAIGSLEAKRKAKQK